MGIVENIAGASFGLIISSIMIFRSRTVARFLEKLFRNWPHDKTLLPEELYEVRPAYIVAIGVVLLLLTMIGLSADLTA